MLRLILAATAALFWAASGLVVAEEAKPQPLSGRTPVPVLPAAKGEKCVAPTDWMRRNHMYALAHQRDRTVHEGIRTKEFSLKGCVDCHAVPGTDGRPVAIADPKHFCRTCHDYAAVKLDCFECHASQPPAPTRAAVTNDAREDVAALARYLEGLDK